MHRNLDSAFDRPADPEPYITAHVPRRHPSLGNPHQQPAILPEIPTRLNDLKESVNALGETLSALNGRLTPVLPMHGSGSTGDNSPSTTISSETPIGEQLALVIGQIRHQQSMMLEVIANLGI